jgi:hypothetical protein
LERKSKPIFDLLEQTNHDWEAVVFFVFGEEFWTKYMVKSFKIAQNIPFQLLEKKF